MAYTATDFAKDLALYTTGAVIGVTRSRKFAAYAAKKGIRLAGIGATRAAMPVARAAAVTPAGRTAVGVAGIVAAYQAGLLDRPIESIQTDQPFGPFGQEIEFQAPLDVPGVAKKAKRKVSNYAKGVKAGMKALKSSKFNGKAGTLSNAKKSFGTVSKTVSALMKGKKVRRTGATGTIARATSKLPGISKITVRK
jgi:hypothetical protein